MNRKEEQPSRIPKVHDVQAPPIPIVGEQETSNIVVGGDKLLRSRREREKQDFAREIDAIRPIAEANLNELIRKVTTTQK